MPEDSGDHGDVLVYTLFARFGRSVPNLCRTLSRRAQDVLQAEVDVLVASPADVYVGKLMLHWIASIRETCWI